MNSVQSPLTGSNDVRVEKEIACSFLIDSYLKQFNIDVRKYFAGLDSVKIFRCLDTGYRFYYPFQIEGDREFYASLQVQTPYMDWKWEHQLAQTFLKPNDSVLEIGCGNGSFLEGIKGRCADRTGLEFNPAALELGREKEFTVLGQSIQEYTHDHRDKHDAVCTFQVLEHVAGVRSFVQAAVDTLKTGGLLVISVPNNYANSPILKNNLLNMPPHHMGLWNGVSLSNLQRMFPLRLETLETEPLQQYHAGFYRSMVQKAFYERMGVVGAALNVASKPLVNKTIACLSDHILGHSILAQFRKI